MLRQYLNDIITKRTGTKTIMRDESTNELNTSVVVRRRNVQRTSPLEEYELILRFGIFTTVANEYELDWQKENMIRLLNYTFYKDIALELKGIEQELMFKCNDKSILNKISRLIDQLKE